MKIVIAPDSFKESLSAAQVATALEQGLRRALPRAKFIKVPMADGGEGTVTALVSATAGRIVRRDVMGPLGKTVRATLGLLGDEDTAVIEMATASGLPLVPSLLRNPLKTTSYGTGQLIAHALKFKVRRLIIGIGGSATNDGGAGMAQALGFEFFDSAEKRILSPLTGGDLIRIARIDSTRRAARLAQTEILVACDVKNPLVGRLGAAAVFGPQKGATATQVRKLDDGLRHYGRLLERLTGIKVLRRPGSGAAGGMGAGLVALLGGQLRPGIDLVTEATELRKRMKGADLVITGEGRVDAQTVFGKTPAGVARIAKELNIPVVALGGGLAEDAAKVFDYGIDALESVVARPMSLEAAIKNSQEYVRNAGERIGKWLLLGKTLADRQ